MKRCKKLLCMVLALIMALSLCTVAMADEEGGTTDSNVAQVEIKLNNFYYGGSIVTATDVDNLTLLKYGVSVGNVELGYKTVADGALNSGNFTPVSGDIGADGRTEYYLKVNFILSEESSYALASDESYYKLNVVEYDNECHTDGSYTSTSPITAEAVWNASTQGDNGRVAFFKLTLDTTKVYKVTIPFTKKVELGGNKAPDSTTFEVEQVGEKVPNVTVTGSVTVKGKGTFNGTITVSGPKKAVNSLLENGFVVKEVNDNAKNWTKYDDAAWFVGQKDSPVVNSVESGDTVMSGVAFEFFKGKMVDGEFVPDSQTPVDTMTFTNTYTKTSSSSKPTTTVVEAPKTFDGGVALCAALSVLSMTGAVVVGKKKF